MEELNILKEKNHLDMYKEMYAKEVERVANVTSRLQWSISIWILLFGGMIYVLNKYGEMKTDINYFYTPLSLAAICSLISMVLIIRGLYDTKMKHIPPAGHFKILYLELKDHYEKLDQDEYNINQNTLEEEFERKVEVVYILATDDIMGKNEQRILYSYWANISMMASGAFLLITFAFMLPHLIR